MARSKKSGIALISALVLFVEFFSNLFKMVKKLGGDEQSVYHFFSSPKGVKKVAELIVPLTISFSDSIVPLKFGYVNSNITEQNFPMQQGDNDPMEYKVFHFGGSISSENVIKAMTKENYRPATLRELLRWAKNNWNVNDRIIALGQIWLNADSHRYLAVLDFDGGRRELGLRWFGFVWNVSDHFLAMRK